jgi:hypothetical protein
MLSNRWKIKWEENKHYNKKIKINKYFKDKELKLHNKWNYMLINVNIHNVGLLNKLFW